MATCKYGFNISPPKQKLWTVLAGVKQWCGRVDYHAIDTTHDPEKFRKEHPSLEYLKFEERPE